MTKKRIFLPIFIGIASLSFSASSFWRSAPAVFVNTKNDLRSRLQVLEGRICSTFGLTQSQWNSCRNSWFDKKCDDMFWSNLRPDRLAGAAVRKAGNFVRRLDPFAKAIIVGNFSKQFKNKITGVFRKVRGAPCVEITHLENGKVARNEDSKVLLNEQKLASVSDQELAGIIFHEIAHLAVETDFICVWIEDFAKKYKDSVDAGAVSSLLRAFNHLHEEIADKLSALSGGLEVARAFAARFARSGAAASESHPSSATRVAYLNSLISQMEADPHYKNGGTYGAALKVRIP